MCLDWLCRFVALLAWVFAFVTYICWFGLIAAAFGGLFIVWIVCNLLLDLRLGCLNDVWV